MTLRRSEVAAKMGRPRGLLADDVAASEEVDAEVSHTRN